MSGTAPDADSAPDVSVEVVRGSATEEELAAVLVVVTEAYAAEQADAIAPEPVARSAWELSARAPRSPLDRAAGWRGFTG